MKIRVAAIAITLILALADVAAIHARGWEPVKTERADAKVVVRENEVEIKSAPGLIQVNSNHPVQIKIFTILGRLVSSESLPQGMMQFAVPAHGVYIVKAGGLTCKVAI